MKLGTSMLAPVWLLGVEAPPLEQTGHWSDPLLRASEEVLADEHHPGAPH